MNPELRRNLWLEATPARLVLVPAILAGVFFLAYDADGDRLGGKTAVVALVCLAILLWGWGAHLASESILAEVRARTWDWQRTSGLGAWTLTWGKLAGATAPAWYGAAVCLLVHALATPDGPDGKGWSAALVVLSGVFGQALTFLAALHVAGRGRAGGRAQSSVYLVAVAVLALQVFTGASRAASLEWWGLRADPLAFATSSAAAFAAFAVVGAWVRVRRELRIRTLSVAWPAFLLFVMLWAAGFAHEAEGRGARPLVAFLVAAAATWGTALLDAKDPVALRRLLRSAREGRWRYVAEELPPWLLALPFVLGACAALLAAPSLRAPELEDVRVLSIAVVLFLVRDLALILYLALGARPRRADLLAVVLLAAGYVLVPLVLSAFGARQLAAAFFPDPERAAWSAVAALVQALAMAGLLVDRWRARARAVEAADGA